MKLIRDGLATTPAHVAVLRCNNNDELTHLLKVKLLEEATEALLTSTNDELHGELADLIEIIRTLANLTGSSLTRIRSLANDKRDTHGGFEGGYILKVEKNV